MAKTIDIVGALLLAFAPAARRRGRGAAHRASGFSSVLARRAVPALALLAAAFVLLPVPARAADELPLVRAGVLEFGTVSWELAAMRHHGLDTANGFALEVVPFAGGDATDIALLGGEVDVIVSDWLWVSRQRAAGHALTFVPYSSSVGAIMVPGDSEALSIADLEGLTIGVAGGPLDKSWLLLQGMARQEHGLDLATANEIVYGAPPLLAEKTRDGELDAMLNYWHYNARLEAEGFRVLSSAEEAAETLGASGPVSSIGFVFDEAFAGSGLAAAFVEASRRTKAILRDSDREWQRLADAGVIKDGPEALAKLRDRYREGIPVRDLDEEIRDAGVIYALLAELGGRKLVGEATAMSEGTYWQGEGARR